MNFIKNLTAVVSCLAVACSSNFYFTEAVSDTDFSNPAVFFSIVKDDPQELYEQYTGLSGDTNNDGSLSIADITSMKNIIFNNEEPSEHSDMNNDGITDVYDLIILKNTLLNTVKVPDKKTICIDAGHYGLYNPSPGVKGYYESNMSWQLHLYLKEELENYGFEVITTRENKETDRGIVSRGQASAGCDFFISLHSNAVGSYMNESTDFPVAIVMLPDDTTDIDEISTAIGAGIADAVANVMQTKQAGRTWTRLSEEDRNDDGILNDEWYGVLFGAKSVGTPGILMEHSFHTNTRSATWLLDNNNLKKLAEAEALVIAEYFGLA